MAEETPPETPWYSTLDDDLKSHVATKGWDKLDPQAAALAAVQAHRLAEKMVGLPADQLLRIPKPEDVAGWDAVWAKLGALKDAAAYKLDAVKGKDGAELEAPFVEMVRNLSASLHLRPEGAEALARTLVEHREKSAAEAATTQAGAQAAEEALLRQNWGGQYDVNKFLASKAVEELGLPKEFGETLQRQVGYAKSMEVLRGLGARMSEASFHGGEGKGGQGPMSRADAEARLAVLSSDKAWFQRFYNGGSEERAEFERLTRIRAGGPEATR